MFSDLLGALAHMTDTTPSTMILISLMCMVGAYMTKDAMANPNGAIMVYPLLVIGSIFASFGLTKFGVFDQANMAGWLMLTFFSTAIGMIFGLSLFIVLNRSINAVIDRNT